MNNDDASTRTAALLNETLAVLQRAGHAPNSPVNAFAPAKVRRNLRRSAARLRMGKSRPRYENLHTAAQLADIYERTVRRDEILEQAFTDFKRITFDLGRVLEENDPKVRTTIDAFITEIKRSAEEHGPGSEAAERYRHLQILAWMGQRCHDHKRRQRVPAPLYIPLAPDPSVEERNQICAAELLPSPPPSEETVIAIPPEGRDCGRGRILFRIGAGESSWIGSFLCGNERVSTIFMMPDGEHLFVSAAGAGYIIDAKARTLAEEIGTDVVGVMRNEPNTLFIVHHRNASLEAFGKTGRLWKTDRIGSGGFRRLALTTHALIGKAQQPARPKWVGFSVNLATGDVRLGGGP